MISHKHKCIFIHIPKTAGTSINSYFYPNVQFHTENADYQRLIGWCPKRKIHMQHATARQLLDTELITEEQWSDYYKFTFIRNPWDRAYSDYLYIQKFSGLKGSFNDYIHKKGVFNKILNDNSTYKFLGDHLLKQSDFFDFDGPFEVDFIGRFENFSNDISRILKKIGISKKFKEFKNKSENRKKDYSLFYSNSRKRQVEKIYKKDIDLFNYSFEDKRKGLNYIKKLL